MKIIHALAILSSVAAMPAMAESFSHDGLRYDYKIVQDGGFQRISGRVAQTGERFSLRVKDARVSGDFAGHSVQFRTSEVRPVVRTAAASVFAAN